MHGNTVELKKRNGVSLLSACEDSRLDTVIFLLNLLEEKRPDVNLKNKDGMTPLMLLLYHLAAGNSLDDVKVALNLLFDAGAEVIEQDNAGISVLLYAAFCLPTEMLPKEEWSEIGLFAYDFLIPKLLKLGAVLPIDLLDRKIFRSPDQSFEVSQGTIVADDADVAMLQVLGNQNVVDPALKHNQKFLLIQCVERNQRPDRRFLCSAIAYTEQQKKGSAMASKEKAQDSSTPIFCAADGLEAKRRSVLEATRKSQRVLATVLTLI